MESVEIDQIISFFLLDVFTLVTVPPMKTWLQSHQTFLEVFIPFKKKKNVVMKKHDHLLLHLQQAIRQRAIVLSLISWNKAI